MKFLFFLTCILISNFVKSQKLNSELNVDYFLLDSAYYEYNFSGKRTVFKMACSGEMLHIDIDQKIIHVVSTNNDFYLDSIVSTYDLVRSLKLNQADENYYLKTIKSGRLSPPQFIDLRFHKNICHLNYRSTHPHLVTESDIALIPSELRKEHKINVGTTVLVSRPIYLILNLDSTKAVRFVTAKDPNNYWIDQFSGYFLDGKSEREFYLPLQREVRKDKPLNDSVFATENFLMGRFSLLDSVLVLKEKLPFLRPRWYSRSKVGHNFSEGAFQLTSENTYYYLTSYPYFVNILNGVQYSLPENELQNICKSLQLEFPNKDEPAFSPIGVIESKLKVTLLARIINQNRTVCFDFDLKGLFIGMRILSNEKNNWLTDGKYLYSYTYSTPNHYRISKFILK
jgi:hypothetical protein